MNSVIEDIKDIVEDFKDLLYLLLLGLIIAVLIVIGLLLHYLFKVI